MSAADMNNLRAIALEFESNGINGDADTVRWAIAELEELSALSERVKRLEEALSRARKIDWESVADRVDNPGDYIGDEQTAKNIRKFAAALEQP